MAKPRSNRREFLRGGAIAAGVAAGGLLDVDGRAAPIAPRPVAKDSWDYGVRSRFETAIRTPVGAGSGNYFTPIGDTYGIITPSSLHFTMRDSATEIPDIDPAQHRLMIHGLVERPLVFTLDELKRLPAVSRVHFLECGGNTSPTFRGNASPTLVQETHGKTGCCEWTGVPLSVLLKEAGLRPKGTWFVAQAIDAGKHSRCMPISKAMDDALVVYGQNGEALRREQGYPLRLVVPGWEGNMNIKWLSAIKIVDQPYVVQRETSYVGMWPNLKGKVYWYNFQMGPKSVITRPSGGQRLENRGFYEITGLAWSGGGAIRRVEVSVDGGKHWAEAKLQGPIHRMAHTRFSIPWAWQGEEAMLMSRCLDDAGEMQPTLDWLGQMRGVNRDWWLTTKTWINHFNPIQPWKVNRDGTISNAMFA